MNVFFTDEVTREKRDKQADRQTEMDFKVLSTRDRERRERQTDRQRQRETETERQRHTQREGETERQRHRETERQRIYTLICAVHITNIT